MLTQTAFKHTLHRSLQASINATTGEPKASSPDFCLSL